MEERNHDFAMIRFVDQVGDPVYVRGDAIVLMEADYDASGSPTGTKMVVQVGTESIDLFLKDSPDKIMGIVADGAIN